TGSEIATARAHNAKPIIIVSDNGSYGTIRMHQEKRYPQRSYGTGLMSPDFAAIGRAHGCLGLTITRNDEVDAAILEALAHDGPVLLHVVTSLKHISPSMTLSRT
ncbi:MAG TPA: thiamine pyrophosphate-dependent enzyme, partial [Afipia sp.]